MILMVYIQHFTISFLTTIMSSISFNGRSFGNLGVDMLAPSLKRFYFTLLFFVKKIDDLMFFLVISNSGPVYFAVPPLVF